MKEVGVSFRKACLLYRWALDQTCWSVKLFGKKCDIFWFFAIVFRGKDNCLRHVLIINIIFQVQCMHCHQYQITILIKDISLRRRTVLVGFCSRSDFVCPHRFYSFKWRDIVCPSWICKVLAPLTTPLSTSIATFSFPDWLTSFNHYGLASYSFNNVLIKTMSSYRRRTNWNLYLIVETFANCSAWTCFGESCASSREHINLIFLLFILRWT